jgi:hypothetical protein
MAVADGDDWVLFKMDAGDSTHRDAFCCGEVPAGADLTGRPRNFQTRRVEG